MKYVKAFIAWVSIIVAGCTGGQSNKNYRRIGVPVIATLSVSSWRRWAFLALIPILALGYGNNSVLMQVFGSDWAVRLVYGLLVSIPFFVYGLRRGLTASAFLIMAYSIHAGSVAVGNYDLLFEDVIRFGVLGGLVVFNVIKK